MSFLPDDRGAELRALFFESAGEILQTINDAGLQLEKRPADEELIRSVRRAVHTLKGDSAACGFSKLSEIAHELEDVLSPQIGLAQGVRLAEVVFSAVDTFESMLAAYRKQAEPPPPVSLRSLIQDLLQDAKESHAGTVKATSTIVARFDWSEYEQLMISEAQLRGENVFNVALRVDLNSAMRAAAFQLIRNVLHACGTVIALRPEDNAAAASVEIVEAALSTKHPLEHVAHRCRIPTVVSSVRIEAAEHAETSEHELLGDLLEAQAAHVSSKALEKPEAAAANQVGNSPAAAVAEG